MTLEGTSLILVGNTWYTVDALNEAIDNAAIRLSAINKQNPQAQAEYWRIKDHQAELLRAARDNNLIESIEFRTSKKA